MGTVTEMDAEHVVVKAMDGKITSILLNKNTKYLRGKMPAAATDLKVGDRVVVESKGEGNNLTAEQIRLSPANKAKGHGDVKQHPKD